MWKTNCPFEDIVVEFLLTNTVEASDKDCEKKWMEEEFFEALKFLERDCNGFFSAADLRHAIPNCGETLKDEEVDDMISEVEVDGDGQINDEDDVQSGVESSDKHCEKKWMEKE